MCDFPNNKKHDCFQFPQLKIEKCEICGKKTCGFTRVTRIVDSDVSIFIGCLDCEKDKEKEKQWNVMIEKHTISKTI